MPTSPPLPLVISGLALRNPSVGLGVYTRRLIEGLLRHAAGEVRLTVLIPAGLPAESLSWLPEGQIRRVKEPPTRLPGLFRDAWLFQRMIRMVEPGAIFHSPAPAWAPSRRRPTIITLHDCIYRRFPRYLGRRFARKWLVFAAERYAATAQRVITVSHCAAEDLAQLARIPREKIEIVYNWVGPEFEAVKARLAAAEVAAKYGLPSGYWLYLGGYDYRKNVEFLIRSYAAATRAAACPPLVLAGEIPSDLTKPYCDVHGALREAGLGEKAVFMPGRIADADLPGLYAGASLFIYPSLCEGFGLPPAEAMAVGVPVLVSDGSSLPEVVEKEECRFDPAVSARLTEKLEAAARDPMQFLSPPPPYLSEAAGIKAYLAILRSVWECEDAGR
jgi:glycosyltransferase involved in cell wall biosynthesis